MDMKKYHVAYGSKEPIDTAKNVEDDRKLSLSRPNFAKLDMPCKKWSKHGSKRGHSKDRSNDLERHSSLSKYSKEAHESCSEAESEVDDQSACKRHN